MPSLGSQCGHPGANAWLEYRGLRWVVRPMRPGWRGAWLSSAAASARGRRDEAQKAKARLTEGWSDLSGRKQATGSSASHDEGAPPNVPTHTRESGGSDPPRRLAPIPGVASPGREAQSHRTSPAASRRPRRRHCTDERSLLAPTAKGARTNERSRLAPTGASSIAPTAKRDRTDRRQPPRTDQRSRLAPTAKADRTDRVRRIAPTAKEASHRRTKPPRTDQRSRLAPTSASPNRTNRASVG
jgi:hypothetical protein